MTRPFGRWATKQGVGRQSLCWAVQEMQAGLYEADLGAGLLKKRIARPGRGKRDGWRTPVATNKGGKWFFVFGFAKSARSNIDEAEATALKRLASYLLSMTRTELEKAHQAGELIEVECHA